MLRDPRTDPLASSLASWGNYQPGHKSSAMSATIQRKPSDWAIRPSEDCETTDGECALAAPEFSSGGSDEEWEHGRTAQAWLSPPALPSQASNSTTRREDLPQDGLLDIEPTEGKRRGQELLSMLSDFSDNALPSTQNSATATSSLPSKPPLATGCRQPQLPTPPWPTNSSMGMWQHDSTVCTPQSRKLASSASTVPWQTEEASHQVMDPYSTVAANCWDYAMAGKGANNGGEYQGMCWDYANTGRCPRGEWCRWMHPTFGGAGVLGFSDRG